MGHWHCRQEGEDCSVEEDGTEDIHTGSGKRFISMTL